MSSIPQNVKVSRFCTFLIKVDLAKLLLFVGLSYEKHYSEGTLEQTARLCQTANQPFVFLLRPRQLPTLIWDLILIEAMSSEPIGIHRCFNRWDQRSTHCHRGLERAYLAAAEGRFSQTVQNGDERR